MMKFDKKIIDAKRKTLNDVAAKLKTEFFGLDDIIDKVIKSINAWYIFPEIIARPVIINLWGMTGVGKTQLVRRLASLLDYSDRFVEIQMDGGSSKGETSIAKILSRSSIEERAPGILLLDEIQRFKTVDESGSDIKLDQFQDVWTLLSDGKFSADSNMFQEIEMMIAQQDYQKDYVSIREPDEEDKAEAEREKLRKFKIYPYEANSLKKTLRLSSSVKEIMTWTPEKIEETLNAFKSRRETWEIDYSKLIIFISGNLDGAFVGSGSIDDCDTDADFYHEETKKISVTDIKSALKSRFRPEQISRFGNNHIIYPSMSKKSYQKLIETTVNKYLTEMTKLSGISFTVSAEILSEIYNNSVFPTQGTRPVFSSIHLIFSSLLSDITFWAIENDVISIKLDMNSDKKSITAYSTENLSSTFNLSKSFQIELEMNIAKERASIDFKTIVATHEAGHALVYAILSHAAPKEVKINVLSFKGGYMMPGSQLDITTKTQIRNQITTYLGGLAAEELIYGVDHRSNGSAHDIMTATQLASNYIRHWGYDTYCSYINSGYGSGVSWNTSITETNEKVEELIVDAKCNAMTIIKHNVKFFKAIVDELIKHGEISQDTFIQLANRHVSSPLTKVEVQHEFNEAWKTFKKIN